MSDLRLALRLVRGSGSAGLARLVLMGAGLATGVVAVMLVVQTPGVLADRNHVQAQRYPVIAYGGQRSSLTTNVVQGWWQGRPVVRVFVAGVGPGTPTPPGVRRLPGPGQVVLSPAAAALGSSSAFGALVPGKRIGAIGPPGLAGPDELVAYIGVGDRAAGSPTLGWGVADGSRLPDPGNVGSVGLELAVLVLPAALVLLVVCGRLATATRRRRYAALSLVGAAPRTIARVAGVEAGVAAIIGVLAGLALFGAANRVLAREGWLGITWFAQRVGPGAGQLVLIVAVAGVGARITGTMAARRAATDGLAGRRNQSEKPPQWWRVLPLLVGVGLLAPLLPWRSNLVADGSSVRLLFAGAILSILGLFLAAAPVTYSIALMLTRAGNLSVRLGAARLRQESAKAVRLVGGLGLLVIAAGIGAGITSAAEGNASSAYQPIEVHVDAGGLAPAVQDRVGRFIFRSSGWASVFGGTIRDGMTESDSPTANVSLLVAPCNGVRQVLQQSLPECGEGHWYRVLVGLSDIDLQPGASVPFNTDAGVRTVRAPVAAFGVHDPGGRTQFQLAFTGSALPGGWTSDTTFHARLSAGPDQLDAFASRLAEISPEATADGSLDPDLVEQFRVNRAAILLGVRVAYLLGLVALFVSVVDRAFERRRQVAALVVLGSPRRTIRLAEVVGSLVPMLVTSGLALVVEGLVVNAFNALDNVGARWTWVGLVAGLPLAGIGLLAAAASGLVVLGLSPRAEDLRSP